MTYEQYIEETRANCAKVLSDCSAGELLDVEYLRKILWEDDRVTGVISGYCTSSELSAAENIKDVLFDSEFLKEFNERNMNMQEVMAYGAEAIDVAARCLALRHISIRELVEKEQKRRRQIQRESARRNAIRV
jgi:hypothetical protein